MAGMYRLFSINEGLFQKPGAEVPSTSSSRHGSTRIVAENIVIESSTAVTANGQDSDPARNGARSTPVATLMDTDLPEAVTSGQNTSHTPLRPPLPTTSMNPIGDQVATNGCDNDLAEDGTAVDRLVDVHIPAAATRSRNTSHTLPRSPPPIIPNKFEIKIHAGPDSVTDDPLLLLTPYVVNTKYQALICMDCKHGVEPDNALSHIRTSHSHCRPSRTLVAELKKDYPGLRAEKIVPTDPDPVFGLAIPLEDYIVCTSCRHGYLNVASWRAHACKNGSKDQSSYFKSLVQTFFRGNKLHFFPITMPPSSIDEATDDFQAFQAQNPSAHAGSDEEPLQNASYRELNQFLRKEGWLDHVSGYQVSELCELVAIPARNDDLSPVAHEVFGLMSNIQSVVSKAGFHVRRLLGRRPS